MSGRRCRRLLVAIGARRHYALVLGAAFWALMAAHVIREGGRWARDALPVGWDFHVFHAAGRIVAQGRSDALYDHAALTEAAKRLVPGDYPVFDYLNPPHFAALFAAFSPLPHGAGFALYTAFNFIALAIALGFLSTPAAHLGATASSLRKVWARPRALALAYALSGYPVVSGFFAGQNCFLSLMLMAATCALALRGSAFGAGALTGVLLYKPQLALGFLVLFALDARLRAKALLGFALVALLVLGANAILLPEASRAYWGMLAELPARHAQFRLVLAFTARAFFELLLPRAPALAAVLGALTSLASIVLYALFVKREPRLTLRLAGAIWLSLAATPHASIYEWTLLLVPLALIRPALDALHWVAIGASLLVASYLSGPLADAMLERVGFGVQVAMPVFFGVAWHGARMLKASSPR
jgi:hypothetical protein